MPMERVNLSDAISKPEFHSRLRTWLHGTDDTIGGVARSVFGRTAWVHVLDGASTYKLNADTSRKGVDDYLRLVKQYRGNLDWVPAESNRGQKSRVEFGPKPERIRGFYLYLVGADKSATSDSSRPATDADIEGLRYEIITMKTKRSRKLRDTAFNNAKGVCAVCHRDFSKVLGGRGQRVLQVHHRRMISQRHTESVTKLSDLVVVCANCHLLLHLDPTTPMTVPELRKLLRKDE